MLALCHQSIPLPFIQADASHGTDKRTAKSYSGLVACLASGPVAWASHLQSVVALSSTEAELIALVEAVRQALYMRKLYNALDIPLDEPTSIYCDNQSTIKIITKPPYAYHSRLKHMTIKEGFIYDNLKRGVVNVIYVPSNDNMADFLTKAVPAAKLRTDRAKLNMFLRG
jgi:hypothetical protein